MSKKRSTSYEAEEVLEIEEEKPVEEPAAEEPKQYFETVNWKGVKTVYRCSACGTCRDERDTMILHVLLHVPPQDQNKVFETLMKEN